MMPFDRVMQAYGMMVNLTPEQEQDARDRLRKFLEHRTGTDQELAVQGLQFLRGRQGGSRRGRPKSPRRFEAAHRSPASP
jgi:hypothetical protein